MSSELLMYGLGGLATLVATGYGYLVYCGLHHKVVFEEGDYPLKEMLILYKFGKGPYNDVGPIFKELTLVAPGLHRIGIYYDDISKVKPEDNRWLVAAIVVEGLKNVPDPQVVQNLINFGYKRHKLPSASRALQSNFPNKGFVSIMLSMKKVWPSLLTYYEDNPKYPKSEVWIDVYKKNEANYYGLLDKDLSGFYVPEALIKKTEALKKDE